MIDELQAVFDDRAAAGIDDHILKLDHIAYRVRRGARETTMAELINLLPYREYKTFEVLSQHAVTSCVKLHETLPVVVISEGVTDDSVVERYCRRYGSRVHHIAYLVDDIDAVVAGQRARGVEFTTPGIIGSESEGIRQIFTLPTETTNHIIEYVQRYGGFDGFFTPSNIGELMRSTERLGEA